MRYWASKKPAAVGKGPDKPDITAIWVIGPYLVILVIFFVSVWVLYWLLPDLKHPLCFSIDRCLLYLQLPLDSFKEFRRVVLSACSAGIGGAVFMIREFYIHCSGKTITDNSGEKTFFLRNRDIPRYVLLPFSSIILGPISIFLLRAGAIVFIGLNKAPTDIPEYAVTIVGFVFGYCYHDALRFIRKLFQRLVGQKGEDEK